MIPGRYTFADIKRGLSDPSLIVGKAHEQMALPYKKINNFYFRRNNGGPHDIMDEDWDNLIILDACRFDYFKEQNTIDGDLNRVVSGASESWRFMQEHFVGRSLHDTVYVTANPHAERLEDDVFFKVENLLLDKWDEDVNTVRPEDVVDAAINAYESYSDKKLIVHFMQPHTPWLGPTADEIRDRVDLPGTNRYHGHNMRTGERRTTKSGEGAWSAAKRGEISVADIRQAYSETLDIVLKHAKQLVDSIPGKSVITADHGEMLGERVYPFTRKLSGHRRDFFTEELCHVPWLETDGERRHTTADEPIGFDRLSDQVVQDRLQALGYTAE